MTLRFFKNDAYVLVIILAEEIKLFGLMSIREFVNPREEALMRL